MAKKQSIKKILVVEDETFLVKIYSVKLKKEGYDVAIATDGEEAVATAPRFDPDLILLDLILPKMSGFEVLAKLKANPATAKVPVIVLSNLGQSEDVERAKTLGAIDYLIKSNFSIQEVVEKIKSVLD